MIIYSYRALNLIPSHKKRTGLCGIHYRPGNGILRSCPLGHCIKLIWLKVDHSPSEKMWRSLSWDDFPFPTVSGKSLKIPWFQSPPTSYRTRVSENFAAFWQTTCFFSKHGTGKSTVILRLKLSHFFGGMCNLPHLITGEYHQFHAVSPWIFPVLSPSKHWLNHEKSPFPMIIPWNVP